MKETDFVKYVIELDPRIKFLKENKKYIEAFLLLLALLEKELQYLIGRTENVISLELIDIDITFNFERDVEGLTLGQLINRFEVYYKNFKNLQKLKEINKLRCKCVHGLFKNKLQDLELDIIWKFPMVYEVLESLADIELKLNDNEKKSKIKKINKITKKSISNSKYKTKK